VNQGINSIAIGENAGFNNQNNNTIIINASGNNLDSGATSALYINPIRNDTAKTGSFLIYSSDSEVSNNPNISVQGTQTFFSQQTNFGPTTDTFNSALSVTGEKEDIQTNRGIHFGHSQGNNNNYGIELVGGDINSSLFIDWGNTVTGGDNRFRMLYQNATNIFSMALLGSSISLTNTSVALTASETITQNLRPSLANTSNLGSVTFAWRDIFSLNPLTVTSDENMKNNIFNLPLNQTLEFIRNLIPKRYTYISDENNEVHFGFIAQDIKSYIDSKKYNIKDFSLWREITEKVVNEETKEEKEMTRQALRYGEIIAPLVKVVQYLDSKEIFDNIGINQNFSPTSNNTVSLGKSNLAWSDIFSNNSVSVVSDKKFKKNIKKSDLGLDFVLKLSPVKYKYKKRKRTHYGLIAQDVKKLLGEFKIETEDFAAYVENKEGCSLRYGEFIPILIKSQQEIHKMIKNMESNFLKLHNTKSKNYKQKFNYLVEENNILKTQIQNLSKRLEKLET